MATQPDRPSVTLTFTWFLVAKGMCKTGGVRGIIPGKAAY
jgi:hypothetical protein